MTSVLANDQKKILSEDNLMQRDKIDFSGQRRGRRNNSFMQPERKGTISQVPVDDNPYGVHALFFSIVG